ncbi:MAG TPA: CHRD domain-containing protein [Roseiflexaceae bacterium]|nr:CHRD domain-containing protein [Roseiflexaceae bacterium]HMP40904.1 CHRD domain-containing protein [Roseiflexaceae bacterium]
MRRFFLMVMVLIALVSVTTAAGSSRHFRAHASGDQEVPPATTLAQGQANFTLSKDGSALHFRVNVAQLKDVRFAHIHLAPAGVNGPVVAFLQHERFDGPVNGRYAEGVITAADLIGPLAGQPLSALIAAMEAGNTYVNVHTDTYPGGEIRGQIK